MRSLCPSSRRMQSSKFPMQVSRAKRGLVALALTELCISGCAQSPSVDPTALPETLAGAKPVHVDTLPFDAHHVQGLIVTADAYLITSVDRKAGKAWLFRVDRETMQCVIRKDITVDGMIHPGGMDRDGNTFWVPIAEYDRDGPSLIQQRDLKTLERIRQFRVEDHIGATAVQDGKVYGANWDARQIYCWSKEGKQFSKIVNDRGGRYQDFVVVGKYLVASGHVDGRGVIDWIVPQSLDVVKRIQSGKTPNGALFAREGISFHAGRLYFLPEDGRSKIYAFDLEKWTAGT